MNRRRTSSDVTRAEDDQNWTRSVNFSNCSLPVHSSCEDNSEVVVEQTEDFTNSDGECVESVSNLPGAETYINSIE